MKYLSLFSGIGGFELGLENSRHNFECVGFSEIDGYAKSIYLGHFPRHKDLGDASKIDTEEIEDFELLVGGFPCQSFSISGKRLGFDDTRGTLFFEIARILKEKKPKYFLIENVKGLLSHDGSRTFKKMLGIFAELGYDVEWEIYNSKSFSVPQNRERLYLKGYFRAKCGGEILSQRRNRTEIDSQELNLASIQKVGNLSNTDHNGKNVYSSDGLCPTLCRDSVPKNGLNILETEPKLHPTTFNRQVKKRVHSVDYDELSEFLRSHKKAANATIKEISEKLGIKKSEVEHWFRTDRFFAPPPSDVWHQLKELLNIRDDKYDAFITEFEYVDGVYESDKRCYSDDGLSPTLDTKGESLIKIVGNLSRTNHGGENVYDTDGITGTINANNYKHPLKIVEKESKCNVIGNINPNKRHQSGDVYGTDGLCRSLTCTDDSHPVNILEVEKVYNTTRKFNECDTDGTYSPCLTQSMGTGGGNVPMLKLKTNTEKGYDEVTTGDGVRLCHPSSTKARGRTQKEQIGALSTSSDWGTVSKDYRIRRLTPLECERLQAFPDGWTKYGKDGELISDTQRYKCLGNAVTTTVVTYIANTMFGGSFES